MRFAWSRSRDPNSPSRGTAALSAGCAVPARGPGHPPLHEGPERLDQPGELERDDELRGGTRAKGLEQTADSWYRRVGDDGRRYNLDNATVAKPGGDTSYEFHGVGPPEGHYWAYSRANMAKLWDVGRIVITPTNKLYIKRYLDESKGVPLQDLWLDIDMLRGFSSSKERLGYPTQKPLAFLERVINLLE